MPYTNLIIQRTTTTCESRFTISVTEPGGIEDSAYKRAVFALVAILNQILEEAGSEDRAFGVNEGNAFGVAFLSEPLRKIISKVADDESKPVTQKQLEENANESIAPGEPPLVTRQ